MNYNDVVKEAESIFGDPYGKCKEYVDFIAERINGLQKVRGFYHCPIWGKRQHWWLEDSCGNILDPTVSQFPSGGMGEYEEYDYEIHKTPIGRCINCGELVFENKVGRDACDERCYSAIVASLF